MQCLMCVADHLANAMENWRAMCRNPDYARSPDGSDSHLCDFRADICQAEAQCWQSHPHISSEIRGIKKTTEDVLNGAEVTSCENEHAVFVDLRAAWEMVMEAREAAEATDDGS